MNLVREQVLLADLTSWQVGGAAQFFCAPRSEDDLAKALIFAESRGLPVHVISGGTNLLVSDAGVRGLVVHMRGFGTLQASEKDGRFEIVCGSGVGKSELLKIFLRQQLAPAIFLAGIPGDVGGGIAMNAGISEAVEPREFHEIVDWVQVMQVTNGRAELRRFAKADLQWSYRHCSGWQPGVIVRAGLSWPMRPDPQILQTVRQANQVRLSKQPLELPSCGSVFVNPPGDKAGRLIESCGLKGFQVGGAQVSEKHANFIVNLGGATAEHIDQVIRHVRKTVHAKTGIDLKTEVVHLS